ncbi:MAG: sigma-70 family RNA polymerase sigma factor [Verrucomicrobiaceae bacterium]|nr:sigma-70 family RNA polymerase sigma factor [Verrucomicrobiaceae bacterium]
MGDEASDTSSIPFPADGRGALDVGGFERVLVEHEAAVRLYVRSLMPGYEGADDLAQETLLRLWEKREQFVAGTYFKAWAFQIAKYLVLNQRRKLARSPVVLLDEELMEQIDHRWMERMDMGVTASHQEALTQCLQTLKQEDQRLLHARYATDASLETYASQEGTRPGTLKARLFRLRGAIRDCIQRRLSTP